MAKVDGKSNSTNGIQCFFKFVFSRTCRCHYKPARPRFDLIHLRITERKVGVREADYFGTIGKFLVDQSNLLLGPGITERRAR